MKLTYSEAQAEILEPTEIGWTQKSKDRLWTCFIIDDDPESSMKGNRLFFDVGGLSYDMWDDQFLWTSREEAEEFRREQQERFNNAGYAKPPKVHVINWGDDSRWEQSILTKREGITHGKFAGSNEALAAMNEAWEKLS